MSKYLLLLTLPIWLLFHLDPTTNQEYYLTVPLVYTDCELLKHQYELAQPNTKYMCINLDGDSDAPPFTIEGIIKDILKES